VEDQGLANFLKHYLGDIRITGTWILNTSYTISQAHAGPTPTRLRQSLLYGFFYDKNAAGGLATHLTVVCAVMVAT
jgi:hypothetical protein